jgi:hypothetical protein
MKPLITFALAGIIFISIQLTSCQHEPEAIPGRTVCFTEVQGIFSKSCNIPGCHDGKSEIPYISDWNVLVPRYVTAGKPMESRLYKVLTIKNHNSESFMPQNGEPLPRNQIDIISMWILLGAQDKCVTGK